MRGKDSEPYESEPKLKIDSIMQMELDRSSPILTKEFSTVEIQNWRKRPTMKVSDMANNHEKALIENVYLAEKKFKLRKRNRLSF